MHVIAKMDVASVEDFGWSRKLKLKCVYDSKVNTGESSENVSFTKATPSGEAWMTVDNEAVWPAFSPPTQQEDGTWKPASMHYVVFIDANEYSLQDVYQALAALESLKG